MKSFISLEEAINLLDEQVHSLEVEEVSLIQAVGQICGETIYSSINNPPFVKSAMDGYARNSVYTKAQNCRLRVIGELFAGSECLKQVTKQTAIKIMTGAPIPIGADAVIKKEEVIVDGDFVEINRPVLVAENICPKGEDITIGTLLVQQGKKIDYADIGILASAGIEKVKVHRKPRVAFISTGDEVVDVGQPLTFGKVYNSNKYALIGRLTELGYEVTFIDHENDCIDSIAKKIKQALKMSDLLITTGGASVGDKDLIKEAIDHLGGTKLFWKVLIKPGSALLCSKYNQKMIISLSGNPTAALTTFELITKPVLEKLAGHPSVNIKREQAQLQTDIKKVGPQRRFIRGQVNINCEGQEVIVTQQKSGNSILSSALQSNCLIEILPNERPLQKGQMVSIIKL